MLRVSISKKTFNAIIFAIPYWRVIQRTNVMKLNFLIKLSFLESIQKYSSVYSNSEIIPMHCPVKKLYTVYSFAFRTTYKQLNYLCIHFKTFSLSDKIYFVVVKFPERFSEKKVYAYYHYRNKALSSKTLKTAWKSATIFRTLNFTRIAFDDTFLRNERYTVEGSFFTSPGLLISAPPSAVRAYSVGFLFQKLSPFRFKIVQKFHMNHKTRKMKVFV